MAATRARQVKTLEKVILGIRSCTEEKLQQLQSEFVDHQEWLRQTIADTKEHKDALGLVCPPTARKAKKAASRMAQVPEEDKENVENGKSRTTRGKSTAKSALANNADDDMSVFDPEEVPGEEGPPAKQAKTAAGKTRGGGAKQKSNQNMASSISSHVLNVENASNQSKMPTDNDYIEDLQKMKVVDLKADLQKRGLSTSGVKGELVARLAAAMCSDAVRANPTKCEMFIGKKVMPRLGMRVLHILGNEHGSSRGLPGIIEFIPGRGAEKATERSVSVRWMSDMSDVRGPYYTGESCDRGSGIGSEKYDLICIDDVEADIDSAEGVTENIDVAEEKQPEQVEAETHAENVEEAENLHETIPDLQVNSSADFSRSSGAGSKRKSDGSIIHSESNSPVAPEQPAKDDENSAPTLMQKLGNMKQAWANRESIQPDEKPDPAPEASPIAATAPQSKDKESAEWAASQQEPVKPTRTASDASSQGPVNPTPTSGKTALSASQQTPTDGGSQSDMSDKVSESVQQFRAIISRIHGGKTPDMPTSGSTHDAAASSNSSASSAARASAPRVLSTHMPGADLSSIHSLDGSRGVEKSGTWPIPVKPTSFKAYDMSKPTSSTQDLAGEHSAPKRENESASRAQQLTSEALMAHVNATGNAEPVHAFSSKPATTQSSIPKVLDIRVSSSAAATAETLQQSRLDAQSRQQRAAENRAKLEDENRRKALEQEKKRKELDQKRIEAEKIAAERRAKECQAQQEKVEALENFQARIRAQQDEERRVRAQQEQDDRKRLEKQRAEEERLAAAAIAAKQAIPTYAGSPAVSSGSKQGLFGGIGAGFMKVAGSVFGGQEQQIKKTTSGGSNEGPTSIQIQMEKNSDDSESEEEGEKKQPPLWARSPNLRMQLERQDVTSPTPIFGENHQPKRRKYDKRTSSADWGEDGRASYMEEERFQRKMIQNMAMQQQGKKPL